MKTINTPISFTNENSQKCVVIAHGAAQNVVVIANDAQACAMREASPPLNRTMHLLLLLLFLTHFSFAGNFTWTGATNTDWATASNWSGNISGPPSTNDTVSIITQTNLPVLAANTTIKKFTMTSGTLDCNGFALTISANATFNGGTINNGTLTCSGTSTLTFAGTAFGVVVNATGNNLLFNGSVFNSSLTAVKKGSSNDNSIGNNVFNGVVNLTDSGSGSLVLSNTTTAPDTFNSTLTVSATSTGAVYLAHQGTGNVFNGDVTFSTGNIFSNTYGTAAYNGNITLNSASGNISFGNSTGSWTLVSGKNITIGTFSAGSLTIRNLTQSDNSINMRLVLTGTGKLVLGNNSISAKLYASSNQLTFSATRFLSADTLIYTGGNNATSAGGNYFGSTVYIANTFSGNNYHFTIGSASVDTFTTTTTIATTGNTSLDVANGLFLGAVTFKNSITGTLSDRFYVWDCTFKGALTLDGIHSAIKFKNGTGNSLIDSSATLSLVSGYAGQLTLSYIEQRGSNAVNLNMSTNTSTGNNTILTIGPNAIFNSNFYYLGQRLELNGGTFNGSASFTRFSQQLDVCEGGNVFNGVTQICDSVAATTANRVFKLANTTADDFNGNVTFKQYGTGSSASTMKLYPSYTANSTFAGNVIVESNNVPIEFGANGGKVILDGTGSQSISKVGSCNPAIKKLEVNKSLSTCTLNLPLTVSDSLIFKKGFIASDTTNLLLIPDNGIVTGACDTSFATGYVKKTGNDAFTFPIGVFYGEANHTPSEYHPLSISAPANVTDAFTAKYFWANHNKGTSADSTIENESICEYWKLERNAGTSNVTVKLGWNTLSCNVYGLDSLHVAVWDTATSKWKDKGNGGTTGNLTSGTVVSSSAISTFGIMTLADKFCTTLKPVATATDITCPGNKNGTAKVSASGGTPPFSFNWSSHPGGSVSLWDLDTGTYYVTVTDSRGCAITDSAIISNPDSINLTIVATPSDCHVSTGTAKIIASGGSSDHYYYFWTPGGERKDSIGGLSAGIYNVVVSDQKGCSIDTFISISDSDGPEAEVDSLVNVDCYGNNSGFAHILSGSGETDPTWPCWGPDPTRLAAGTYPIMVADNEGCYTILDVIITEPTPVTLSISTTQSLCVDSSGSATVVAVGGSGAFTYKWSSGGEDSLEAFIPSGFDTVTVTDGNGCMMQAIAFISDSDGPSLSHTSTDATCFDSNTGGATVSATGGNSPYNYKWYPGGETTQAIDSLWASSYFVVVADSNGCRQIDSILIGQSSQIQVEYESTDASSDTASDGFINLNVFGGTPPYSYVWLPDSQTTSYLYGLLPGSYSVKVSDANQCSRLIGPILIGPNGCPGGYGCHSVNPDLDPIDYPGYCVQLPVCAGCTTQLSIRDFGAIPGDQISDECAFEAASLYINNVWNQGLTAFTLTFEAGQYDIGRQDDYGAYCANNCSTSCSIGNCCYYKKGHDLFRLDGVNNSNWMPVTQINFEGAALDAGGNPTTIFKYPNCIKYGSFDPNTGERYLPSACAGFHDCRYLAYPGSMFQINNSHYITIKRLDLDGNVNNASIGGYSSSVADGIQQPYSGISMTTSSDIAIEDVNSHDFGQDGLLVAQFYACPTWISPYQTLNLSINNSNFHHNRRNGFSWDGGTGVFATNCKFNYNGYGSFSSAPFCGMDIEWEYGYIHCPWTVYNQAVSNGHFINCDFMFNGRFGVVANPLAGTRDFFFTNCNFAQGKAGIGGEAIHPFAPNFNFTCCNFYGFIQGVWNAYYIGNGAMDNSNAKFYNCFFSDEYDFGGGNIVSFRRDDDANYSCSSGTQFHDDVNYPKILLYLGEDGNSVCRALFNNCTFKTNYFNMLGWFHGGSDHGVKNYIISQNCSYINTGLDAGWANCNNTKLYSFTEMNFIGTNTYSRPGIVRNNVSCASYSSYIGNISINSGTPVSNPPESNFLQVITNNSYGLCHDRYPGETIPYNWQLFSTVCDFPYHWNFPEYCLGGSTDGVCTDYYVTNECYDGFCPECERQAANNISSTKKSIYSSYPVPSQSEVYVNNTTIGDIVTFSSVLLD